MSPAESIRIFIGFDPRETVAYHVLVQSLIEHASLPLTITPLALPHLATVLTRPRDPLQSSDFAFSRFLTPYLSHYAGWSLFLDCDMVVMRDIGELWRLRDESYAVQVVKHHHVPAETQKFLGQAQTRYAKKNWSSVVLFNNARCLALTPEYVNRASGLELHQFKWLASDAEIGALPAPWNFLVGYDAGAVDDIALLHYTSGGPYFSAYRDCAHAAAWFKYRERLLATSDSAQVEA